MTIKDIIQTIEDFAPLSQQLAWDNSGPQVGELDAAATGALLTLDVTEQSIETARRLGLNLIISHHPVIFSGLKSLTGATTQERIVIQAIRSGIAIYSGHTNIDAAAGGVSWAMAQRLKLIDVEPLTTEGLGCLGVLPEPMAADQFVEYVKQQYGLPSLRTNSTMPHQIHRVVVMGGSGSSEIPAAIAVGADAMVTGDIKYHDFQRAQGQLAVIDIGHFESEIDTIGIFMEKIQKKYPTFVLHTEKISFSQIR